MGVGALMGHNGRWGEPGVSHIPTKKSEEHPRKTFVVPEDYMSRQEDFIVSMVAHLKRLSDDQGDHELDALYSDLLEGLKCGLKEVNCDDKRQGQVWLSKELKALRKEMHRKEKEWLVCPMVCPKNFVRAEVIL